MKDITEIIKELSHKDSSKRINAAEILGMMTDEKAVDALIPVLEDKNRFVREAVALALGKIGNVKAIKHLTQALENERDEFVKEFLKKAIEKIQSKNAA
ncbi:HEAT repeat domain-containing protein [Chloroflexota bacterium]